MFNDAKGPIEHFSWGKFIVAGAEHSKTENGKAGKGKDIRLIGTEVSKWKEREGLILNNGMITGVFNNNIDTLIIGIGVEGMISCPDKIIRYIKNNGISEVILEKTPDACKLYNQLFHQGRKVALLAHGTC
jgi:hypothetical protein